MSTTDTLKDIFKVKERLIQLQIAVPTGVDIDLMKKVLGIKSKEAMRSAGFANKILYIAGEAVSLERTGLLQDEPALHGTKDFDRLYIPQKFEDQSEKLKEILACMFPMSGAKFKNDDGIKPPKIKEEFDMMKTSLLHRLMILAKELSDASEEDTLETREKLNHYYRLTRLIDQLDQKFVKGQGADCKPDELESLKPKEGEKKLSIDEALAQELLQKFGLVLLQAQYQRPGFKFPFSPRDMVLTIRSVRVDPKKLLTDLQSENLPIRPSIADVVDPKEKEKRILKTVTDYVEKLVRETILPGMGPSFSLEETLGVDMNSETSETLLKKLITSLFRRVKECEEHEEESTRILNGMERRIQTLKRQRDEVQTNLTRATAERNSLTTAVGQRDSAATANQAALTAAQEKVRTLEEAKASLLSQLTAAQRERATQETTVAQAAETQQRLREAADQVTALQTQLSKQEKLQLDLEEKEEKLVALQSKIRDLEQFETLSREQKRALAAAQTALSTVSSEKEASEEKLMNYDAKLNEILASVEALKRKQGLQPNVLTPIEELSQQIQTTLRTLGRPPRAREASEGKNDETVISSLSSDVKSLFPDNEDIAVPDILELKAEFVKEICSFISTLTTMFEKARERELGSILPQLSTAILDSLYKETLPDLGLTSETNLQYGFNKQPARVALLLQYALVYGNSTEGEFEGKEYRSFYERISTLIESLFSRDETIRQRLRASALESEDITQDVLTQFESRLASTGYTGPYEVLFFLYALALRDFLNCLDNVTKPVECPTIPPILERKEVKAMCLPPTSP